MVGIRVSCHQELAQASPQDSGVPAPTHYCKDQDTSSQVHIE